MTVSNTQMLEELLDKETHSKMVSTFIDSILFRKEKLAERLLQAGLTPEDVYIGERFFYDEQTYTMKYECFPVYRYKNKSTKK